MNTATNRLAVGLVCLWVATAPAHAEIIGNWDFSVGTLDGTTGSQVRLQHAPLTDAYKTYVPAYNYYRANVDATLPALLPVPQLAFDTTESFGIQSLGATGRTVLRVPDARGAGPLTGLVADFDPSAPGNKINSYTVIMDVLIPMSTFTEPKNPWVSLFQPRANADGLLFVNTRLNDSGDHDFGVANGYVSGFQPDAWQRIAMVVDLTASAGQPRYMTYHNGVLGAAIETPGADRILDVNGPLSIGSLTDSSPLEAPTLFNGLTDASKSTLFFFNDEKIDYDKADLGMLYVANLQFRDTALSADAIRALGGPTMTAIAVPEPRTLFLAVAGVAALAVTRGFRKRTRGRL